ncbi:hypothetical protein N0A02_12715 [Paraburkholderia acidicola]|uniref:Uncharacterized protein n=1 Tax=Paraburkholderia acidicola TaxID=1912599 RepID=A0ABV1LMX2_9BURK
MAAFTPIHAESAVRAQQWFMSLVNKKAARKGRPFLTGMVNPLLRPRKRFTLQIYAI